MSSKKIKRERRLEAGADESMLGVDTFRIEWNSVYDGVWINFTVVSLLKDSDM